MVGSLIVVVCRESGTGQVLADELVAFIRSLPTKGATYPKEQTQTEFERLRSGKMFVKGAGLNHKYAPVNLVHCLSELAEAVSPVKCKAPME